MLLQLEVTFEQAKLNGKLFWIDKLMPKKSKPKPQTQVASERLFQQLSLEQDLLAPLGAAIAIDHLRNGGHDASNLAPEKINTRLAATLELGTKIAEQFTEVKAGDLTAIELLLYSQAMTLQAAFNQWIVSASCQQRSSEAERFAHLALRAQDQSRKVLTTLAEIKNPKRSTTFVKNFIDKQLNQLVADPQEDTTPKLEASENAPLDVRSEIKTVGIDRQVETVESIHRTSNRRGESHQQSKCL